VTRWVGWAGGAGWRLGPVVGVHEIYEGMIMLMLVEDEAGNPTTLRRIVSHGHGGGIGLTGRELDFNDAGELSRWLEARWAQMGTNVSSTWSELDLRDDDTNRAVAERLFSAAEDVAAFPPVLPALAVLEGSAWDEYNQRLHDNGKIWVMDFDGTRRLYGAKGEISAGIGVEGEGVLYTNDTELVDSVYLDRTPDGVRTFAPLDPSIPACEDGLPPVPVIPPLAPS
jgi:hypothetical protein